LLTTGALCADDPAVGEWLQRADFTEWETDAPRKLVDAMHEFLAQYGHRCVNEGEICNPRWQDEPQQLFIALLTYIQRKPKLPAHLPTAQPLQRLLATVDGQAHKQVQQLTAQLRRLLQLQSDALHAFAHILAGTRRWALAAAHEALADGRLQQRDDVFFFALEEVKQMMTGEWNISAKEEIQATCDKRRATYVQWLTAKPAQLLIGDTPASSVGHFGLPGVTGQVTGPLRRWQTPAPNNCEGAIVGAKQLTSGWALTLPFARALIAADGTPLDPVVPAARAWHIPTVIGLGVTFDQLIESAQTTVDGDKGTVEQ